MKSKIVASPPIRSASEERTHMILDESRFTAPGSIHMAHGVEQPHNVSPILLHGEVVVSRSDVDGPDLGKGVICTAGPDARAFPRFRRGAWR